MRNLVGLLLAVMVHGCACPGLAQTYLEKQEVPSALNFLKNPGFENGVSAWTRGAGCSTNSSVPLSGLKNGNCTGTGAAETKWEQAPTFAEYRPFVGETWKASCNIATISSSMQFCGLFNGSETSCVPVTESASLNAAGYREYAVPISIPADQSSSFTAGVRIKTTGSGVFGTRVDNCYLGPWKGVVGLVSPLTSFSAKVSSTGVLSDIVNGKYFSNTTFSPTDTSLFSIGFTGLSSAPNCTATVTTSTTSGTAIAKKETLETNTGVQIRTGHSTTASNFSKVAYGYAINCELTGIDLSNAQSTVTNVVGLVPKETVYSANSSSGGTISRENVDFINGNCGVTSTSIYTCSFVSGVFTQIPKCVVTSVHASGRLGSIISQSTSQIVVRTFDDSGANVAMDWNIICQLTGTDYDNARKTYDNVPFSPMESGSYTPTLTNTTNISSSIANLFTYVRIGDVVMVHGRPSIQPTAASGTVSELRISLPIEPAANFSSTGRCFGVGGLFRNAAQSPHTGAVSSANGTKLCSYVFNAQTTVDTSNGLSFSYLLK